MAELTFWAGEGSNIANLQGSGLGFFGPGGAGDSVLVDTWQDNTYITNSDGTVTADLCDNIKFAHANSAYVNGVGDPIPLTGIPNALSTLNVRFTHSTAVQVQNVRARIYDRNTITTAANGVHCKFFELKNHAGGSTTIPTWAGSGNSSWSDGSITGHQAVVLNLAQNPGPTGVDASAGGSGNAHTRHDWYLGISASPESIGSKLFAAYISLEYL